MDELAAAMLPGHKQERGDVAIAADEALLAPQVFKIDVFEDPGDTVASANCHKPVDLRIIKQGVERFRALLVRCGKMSWSGFIDIIHNYFITSKLYIIFNAFSKFLGIRCVCKGEKTNLIGFCGIGSHFSEIVLSYGNYRLPTKRKQGRGLGLGICLKIMGTMKIFGRIAAILLICVGLSGQESSLTPLEDYASFEAEHELVTRAQEYLDAGKYVKAAEQYRRAAKLQTTAEKRAGYLLHEAENLLVGKKTHRARQVYLELVNNYRFYIPLHSVLEQMRELADNFEHGRGTMLHLPDPAAAIEIYQKIVECQPGGEQSLPDRLVLGKKLESDGQGAKAVSLYQETVKLLPENADVRLALAQCLSGLARKSDGAGELSRAAMREAESFLKLASPEDPRRALVTEILARAQNDEAARLLARAEFYLVKYHYRPEVARRYLLDILRDYPESTSVDRVKELLAQYFPEDK